MKRITENAPLLIVFLLVLIVHLSLKPVKVPRFQFNGVPKKLTDEIVVEKWEGTLDLGSPVHTSRPVEQFESEKNKARFGGEKKNRVKKETQAPRLGAFREGSPIPVLPDSKEDYRRLSLRDLLGTASNPYEFSDDIEIGPQTLLNTDPVVYASFSNRTINEVYGPWSRRLIEALDQFEVKGRKLESNVYITKLVVIFDAKGSVQVIRVTKSSGVRAFDEAAKRAFWETEPYENPPWQGVQSDGLIRINYAFQLNLKTSVFKIHWMT